MPPGGGVINLNLFFAYQLQILSQRSAGWRETCVALALKPSLCAYLSDAGDTAGNSQVSTHKHTN